MFIYASQENFTQPLVVMVETFGRYAVTQNHVYLLIPLIPPACFDPLEFLKLLTETYPPSIHLYLLFSCLGFQFTGCLKIVLLTTDFQLDRLI